MWDKSAPLTPTERRLLTCLVRNAGRIVSHRKLLEAMSSGKPNSNIGYLASYISRLRKKVEIDPALPSVIITHHRQGYSLAGKEEARWFRDDMRNADITHQVSDTRNTAHAGKLAVTRLQREDTRRLLKKTKQ